MTETILVLSLHHTFTGSGDCEEKLLRYNHLCPWHDTQGYINKPKSMALCIENCEHSPILKHCFENASEWMCISHENISEMSSRLDTFVSEEMERGKMKVVKNTAFILELMLTNIYSGSKLCAKKWPVKVLKKLWFEKIRTPTVKLLLLQNNINTN
ncbi:hypothetical protein RFI_17297 [Reticulomyxa filosa]|uniref:Uncharacterized protein n=1 Tax=Reticulomyxa filosa TaxID=46433 RepID=X6N3Q1_RETFI|nr:hypothetical protein RFI_17297 [Reticulomyxa filosa]|eukprot:ETO19922.1 hypothetical protein RFI_17297 [Reticulomyxa filosa]